MPEYFYHTGLECECLSNLVTYKKMAKWVYDERSDLYAAPVPFTMLDTYLTKTANKFGGVPLLFRFARHSFYAWHTDRKRKSALNCELTYDNARTYFGTPSTHGNFTDVRLVNYSNQMVLLDTTQYHSVANLGDDRVIFTLGFNETPYADVKAYLKCLS